jgi:hypothetical protein
MDLQAARSAIQDELAEFSLTVGRHIQQLQADLLDCHGDRNVLR